MHGEQVLTSGCALLRTTVEKLSSSVKSGADRHENHCRPEREAREDPSPPIRSMVSRSDDISPTNRDLTVSLLRLQHCLVGELSA